MSFWQKLLGSEQPQHKDPGLLLPELLKNYRAEKQLQKQILAHADISPNPSSNEQLRTVAGEQGKIAGRLEDTDLSVIDAHRRPAGKYVSWWRLE